MIGLILLYTGIGLVAYLVIVAIIAFITWLINKLF